jgi:hypothetical protein
MNMEYKRVFYQSKEYEIIYIYESGFCEIKDVSGRNIILIHITEIQLKSSNIEDEIASNPSKMIKV